MEIVKHTIKELIEKLQMVKLKGFGNTLIYNNVDIFTSTFRVADLIPCQSYVVMDRVREILKLRDAVNYSCGFDLLLQVGAFGCGYVDICLPGLEPFPFLPPMVEDFDLILKKDRTEVHTFLINDGMHRLQACREVGLDFVNCVAADKPDWPYYAHPNPNGWADVQRIEGELPENFPKKRYRLPTPELYKQLYRDFNAVFPGVQEDRPKGLIA